MTWPSWIPRVRIVRIVRAARSVPKLPPIIAAFHIATLQPNNVKAGSRAIHRVCAGMQQKQYTVEGWNYACRFRS